MAGWVVAYVGFSGEFKVRDDLVEKGIEVWFPTFMRKVKKRRKHGFTLTETPAFSRYVFIKYDSEIHEFWRLVNDHKKTVTILASADKVPALIGNQTIDRLKGITDWGDDALSLSVYPGDSVYIKAGLFSGMKGEVLNNSDREAQVEISGKIIKIHVDKLKILAST